MKILPILLIAVLFYYTAFSQKIWDGPASGGSWATAVNWNNNTLPQANDIVIFPTGINGTITNVHAGANVTLGGLIVQGNSNITFTNSTSRTITIANGAGADDFSIAAGAIVTMGTNVNITLAAGSVGNNTRANVSGRLAVITGRTYITTNANVLTTVTGTIQNAGTVTGNAGGLLFSNGSTYSHDRAGGSIPIATWATSSTCKLTGLTSADAGNNNQAFGNQVYNCPSMSGATRILGTTGISIAGNLEITNTGASVLRQGLVAFTVGSLTLKGGTFRIGDNTDRTLTVTGNVSVEGGSLDMTSGNNAADRGILNVAGNLSHSGGIITETLTGRGAVNFSGNTIQSFSKGLLAVISNNIDFTINAGATVDFGTSVLNGSTGAFTVSSTGKIITSHLLGLYSTLALGAIQVSGARTYSSGADYEFKGLATGIFTTSTNPQVRNFVVNNTSTGSVILSQPMTVNGVLTLTAGLLTTTTNLLTIGATGSATPATNASYVNGPLAKVFAAPLTGFTFPVGKSGTGFRNIGMTAPSAASTFKAEFFRGLPLAGILGTGITQLSACEYWDLSRTAGPTSTSTKVILSWEANSACGSGPYVTQLSTLKVAHRSGGTWVNEGYQSTTGTNGSGTIVSGNIINTFSPFALASSGVADNPLAVLFDNVKVYENNNGAQIEWTNMTEKDMEIYQVERSSNGTDFHTISRHLPKNNQNDKVDYSAFDATPFTGVGFYRIKAQEITGQVTYSKVLNVDLSNVKKGFGLYPNPVVDRLVNINLSSLAKGRYDLRVVNMAGQDVHKQTIVVQGTSLTQTINLSPAVRAGLYNVIITGADYREHKSFIVQ